MGFQYGQSNTSSQKSQATQNTYTPEQSSLMASLGNYFQGLIPSLSSGTLSPDVQAQKTASADTINKNSSSLGDRMNRFLSSRGYGKSGVAGKAQLDTELGRQGDLAANESSFAGLQLGQNTQSLLAALNFAMNPTGQTSSGTSSGSQSGFQAGASAAFAF